MAESSEESPLIESDDALEDMERLAFLQTRVVHFEKLTKKYCYKRQRFNYTEDWFYQLDLEDSHPQQPEQSECPSCKVVTLSYDKKKKYWCEFCGQRVCVDCLKRERPFPKGKTNLLNKPEMGKMCELCHHRRCFAKLIRGAVNELKWRNERERDLQKEIDTLNSSMATMRDDLKPIRHHHK